LDTSLLHYFLPEQLLENFRIVHVQEIGNIATKKTFLEITIEECNTLPLGYNQSEYESKGFYQSSTIQDFPIRGKAVYLSIMRRRWRHKERTNEVISNDYSFIAEGSKLTQELSDFLKGTGRYPGGHNK